MEQLTLEPMKRCRGCQELLPLDRFGLCRKVKSGRLARCSECERARKRAHSAGGAAPAGHVRLARSLADIGLDAEVACKVVAVWDEMARAEQAVSQGDLTAAA